MPDPLGPIKLWGSRNSGHAFKARMFLMLGGIDHDYEEVDIFGLRALRPEEFQRVARFGEVPVLVHGRQVLAQSNAILLHLAGHFGLFGAGVGRVPDELTSWLFWEANRIGRSYANARYARLFNPSIDPGLYAWFEETAKADLAFLNQHLSGRDFIAGPELTIADLSCSAYLLFADDPGLDLASFDNVAIWLDRIRAVPGWRHAHDITG